MFRDLSRGDLECCTGCTVAYDYLRALEIFPRASGGSIFSMQTLVTESN